MRSKPLLVIAVSMTLSLLLTACGGADSQSSSLAQPPAPAGSPVSPAPNNPQPGSGSSSGAGTGSSSGSGSSGTTQAAFIDKQFSIPNAGHILVADFNHDDRPDLLIYGNSLQVLLNNGGGDFAPPVSLSLPASYTSVAQVALVDFNSDGYLDIAACVNNNKGTAGAAAVYLNDHSGNFVLRQVIPLSAACKGIAGGDANRDGKADLAVTYFTGSATAPVNAIATWFGDAAGHFANPITQSNVALTFTRDPMRNPCSMAAAVGADFDGDGTLDLFLFGYCQASAVNTGDIYLARGDGSGHYTLTEIAEVNTSISGAPYLKDINDDGKIDVVYTEEQFGPHASDGSDVVYALNNGAGGFTLHTAGTESSYAANGSFVNAGSPLDNTDTLIEGFSTESCCAAIPAVYGVKLFTPIRSSPSQTWIYGQNTYSPPGRVSGIASADFDGNGTQDFAVVEQDYANNNSTLHVYLNMTK